MQQVLAWRPLQRSGQLSNHYPGLGASELSQVSVDLSPDERQAGANQCGHFRQIRGCPEIELWALKRLSLPSASSDA